MKKIALDLDGVVFNSEDLYRVYTEMYDTDINGKDTIIDNGEKWFQKRYAWSDDFSNEFYDKYAEKVLKTCSFNPGFELVFDKLRDKFQFIVITARNDFEKDIAVRQFASIGINNVTIFNNEKNKIDILIRENVDYIIDDDERVCINATNNGIGALYFKNNASKPSVYTKVITVHNWGEIYKYLILNNK